MPDLTDAELAALIAECGDWSNARYAERSITELCNDVSAALRAYQALRAQPAWRPIDSAPKDGTVIIAMGDGYEFPQSIYWHATGDRGQWVATWDHDIFTDATHWMPSPPQEPPA